MTDLWLTPEAMERERAERRRVADRMRSEIAATVASQVAGSMMAAALFHPDPAVSAERFAQAQEWMLRSATFSVLGFDAGMARLTHEEGAHGSG